MNCKEVQTALTEDSKSRMDDSIAVHLKECSECSSFCDDLLELEDLALALSTQCRVSPEVESETLARLSRIKPRRYSPLRVGIACLFFLATSVGLISSWIESEEEASVSYEISDTFLLEDSISEADANLNHHYVEVVVQDDSEGEVILRLPSVIEIRQTEPNEEFYVHNVSH